jgi:hypothetical protein
LKEAGLPEIVGAEARAEDPAAASAAARPAPRRRAR